MEHEPTEPKSHFELYATGSEIISLEDPTRIRIIHFLTAGQREFDEIVAFIGKAKSTISEHLDTLEQEKIIESKINEKDARKKSYRFVAKLVGMSSKNEPLIYVTDKKYFRNL